MTHDTSWCDMMMMMKCDVTWGGRKEQKKKKNAARKTKRTEKKKHVGTSITRGYHDIDGCNVEAEGAGSS